MLKFYLWLWCFVQKSSIRRIYFVSWSCDMSCMYFVVLEECTYMSKITKKTKIWLFGEENLSLPLIGFLWCISSCYTISTYRAAPMDKYRQILIWWLLHCFHTSIKHIYSNHQFQNICALGFSNTMCQLVRV